MLHETDLSRTDINLLTLFDAVRREAHVGRAADRLNLSPSAVSHGLARLRRLFGDPLFLRTPKGVVLTARAETLAMPVADILARVRAVMASVEPFDPSRSTRRFVIGAPDAVLSIVLPTLLEALRSKAPGIDLSARQLLPDKGETQPDRAWREAFADLDSRALDIAILPTAPTGARFAARRLFTEDFVIAMQHDHPFAADPRSDHYFALSHVVVSQSGDPQGFVDFAPGAEGKQRRVALTVPNFMMALAAVAEGGMVTAVPRRFAALHAARFGLLAVEAPIKLPGFDLIATLPEVAQADRGTAWLFDTLLAAVASPD
jgi:DNA-binding transcriptional LysR family regulator